MGCNEPPNSRKRKMYCNTAEGMYHCKVCGEKGGTYLLQKFFGDDPKVALLPGSDPAARRRILEQATNFGQEMLLARDDVLNYLIKDRGLSAETIVERKLGFIGGGWSLIASLAEEHKTEDLLGTGLVYKEGLRKGEDFFYDHILIPYTTRGTVVQLRGKKTGGRYMTGPGESVRLFNADSLDGAEDVLIVEGEFDCMVVEQALKMSPEDRVRRFGAVGLAGADALPTNFETYFTTAKRVYIALDPDDAGRKASVRIKELLGTKARIVELPRELPKCDWCADEETEALTQRGWLRYDEVQAGDEVWSVDPVTNTASWAPVASVFREHRDRSMVHLQAETHDSLTTPDHRWLTQRGFVLTRDLRPSDRLPLTADSELPTQAKYDDDLVELVAWYYTEGHVRSAGVSIAQAEPKASRLRALLTRLFGAAFAGPYMDRLQPCWRERLREWGVIEFDLNARASAVLREVCPDKTPSMDLLTNLTAAQLDLFIDVSVDCDGWRRGRERYFVQADIGRRDAFVTACALRGYATRVSARQPAGHGLREQWVVNVLQRREARVASLRRTEVAYSGVIWCPSVPGRSTWFARRNGKSYFTGNTEYLLPTPTEHVVKPSTPEAEVWAGVHPHGGHDWRDIMSLIGNASGKRVFSLREAGVSHRNANDMSPGIKTGYIGLDSALQPGLKAGQVTVILAKTGCIAGDADIAINRCGKGFTIKLVDLVNRFNGGSPRGGRKWDLTHPTYVQREVDGEVRLGRLINAWSSGVKKTYTVLTNTGRTIRATDEHPFMTERGWLRLDQLVVGDLVHVRGEQAVAGAKKPKPRYAQRVVRYHPHANRRNVKNGGHTVPLHRLVVEASLNMNSLDMWVSKMNDPAMVRWIEAGRFQFLDPAEYAVHHVDRDPSNNDLSNLKVLTHAEHAAQHADEGSTRHVQIKIATERVVHIEPHEPEETYDLEVADDPHNFLANGFVVHNTGKTIWLCNLAYNMRAHKQLIVSLEMTREEVYERLMRIYFFHHPQATIDELEFGLQNIMICDENRLSQRDFEAVIEDYEIESDGRPAIVHLDYLGYFARGQKGNGAYERTTEAIMQCKALAKSDDPARRTHIITPAQVNRGAAEGKPITLDDARDSGAIEETADFLISLYNPDAALQNDGFSQPSGQLRSEMLKGRHGNVGRTFAFMFDSLTLAIVDKDSPAAKRVEEHNYLKHRGWTWEQLRARETEPVQLRMGRGA